MTRHRMVWISVVLALACVAVVLGLGVGVAPAFSASPSAKLRVLTEGARSFGSDGVRYVVYVHRLPGERDASRPPVIVDTANGMSRRSVRLPAGCTLGPGSVAMTRGFLLACSRPGETVLVDLAHGSLVRVPSWFDVGGVPQFAEFSTIGRQWLRGIVGCPGGFGQCVAYENRHTGEQRIEGPLGVVRRDLDDPALGPARACAPFERFEYFQSDGRHVLLSPHGANLALGRCGHDGVRLLDPSGSGADQALGRDSSPGQTAAASTPSSATTSSNTAPRAGPCPTFPEGPRAAP